jgi:hypothetical protein
MWQIVFQPLHQTEKESQPCRQPCVGGERDKSVQSNVYSIDSRKSQQNWWTERGGDYQNETAMPQKWYPNFTVYIDQMGTDRKRVLFWDF